MIRRLNVKSTHGLDKLCRVPFKADDNIHILIEAICNRIILIPNNQCIVLRPS